ncbi:MAG TPA: Rne/Rng family ribonuclease [Bdellovibrionota bacterium]|nr:Rne/Rng family ribonuclease [Bdellovibrionota bacterium]
MASRLVINSTPQETRVAVMEEDHLAELYTERPKERGIVGNIYKGKVVRVLPGMQASFVDIGLERAAFLYVTDFFDEYRDAFSKKEIEEEKRRRGRGPRPQIQDLLKEGQDVLVQVAKDPMGTKGARLTSHISLAGRHLVYMPTVNHVGVSRKIETDAERRRLREIVDATQTTDGGFIIRTASAGQPDDKIEADVKYLERLWKKVLGRRQGMKAPAIIHQDLDLIQRVARDFFTEDVEKLIVDDKGAYREIMQFLGQFLSREKRNVELYHEREPIFDHFGIEPQIDRALGRKVWLKSGGSLIIDQTEALTSIDVNTGRFVGTKNLEETILKTNLEALKEIVAQLRLRNIGGLIILDFIDMEKRNNRERVYRALEDALADDKAKTNVLQISELGIVEMTRKRTRESLNRGLCEPCAHCDGKGFHRSRRTVAYTILRKLREEVQNKKSYKNIEIVCHSNVAGILKNEEMETLQELENRSGRRIVVRDQANYSEERFEIKRTGHALAMEMPEQKEATTDTTIASGGSE